MRSFTTLALAAAVAFPLAFAACDRTVTSTTHTKTDPNGNVQEEKKTITQDNNGGTTVTQEKTKTVNNR